MDSIADTSAALAPATARFDRQRADARQQRWMAELEQMMLAQPMQRPAAAAPVGAAEPEQVRGGRSAGLSHGGAAAAGRADAAMFDPARGVSGATGGDNAAQLQAKAGLAPAAEAAGGEHGQAAADVPETEEETVGQPAIDGATLAHVTQATGAPASVAGLGANTDTNVPGVSPAQGAAIAGTGVAGIAPNASVPAAGIAMVSAVALHPVVGAVPMQAGQPLALVGEEAVSHGAQDSAAPAEEYERQLLHLFHGEDGVQVFIRDAELKGAQLRMVAQALAMELGGSGQRLAGLTVNGRRVALAPADSDEEPQATPYDAPPPPITEKGNI